MSATGQPSRNGRMAQESWSLDHCEAEVAHLYTVLNRYRSKTRESGWAQFDSRPRVRADGDETPAAADASRGRQRA